MSVVSTEIPEPGINPLVLKDGLDELVAISDLVNTEVPPVVSVREEAGDVLVRVMSLESEDIDRPVPADRPFVEK